MIGLRKPAERRSPRGAAIAQSLSLPAPVGGLNARDAIAAMKPTDALLLDNLFPGTTSVEVRHGYTSFATFTGQCESVLVYSGLAATRLFPCIVNGATRSIFNGTSGGALSVAVVGGAGPTVQAVTSCHFDHQNYGTVGGQFLSAVNGADTPLQYDGTTWSASTMTIGVGTTAELFTNAVYAERLWFARANTFDVFYLPVNSITGALTRLNLASLFKLGGSLNSIITVTDASNTLTDYIGFLSTEGELVAFSGTDPASAATWSRVAHVRLGRPVCKGNRAWTKAGADAFVLCADGVFPVRRAISTDGKDRSIAITDKIRNLLNADLQLHGTRYGWALTLHPSGSKLLVNVPTLENTTARQYAMNVQTGAWCRFTGWNAFSFEVARDQLYFGGNGVLAKADQASAKKDGESAIACEARQAFSYLGTRGRTKHLKLMRPTLALTGPVSLGMSVDLDFSDSTPQAYLSISGATGDPFAGAWDAAWGGALSMYSYWHTVLGEGHAVAPRLKLLASDIDLSWSATDLVYETGSALG